MRQDERCHGGQREVDQQGLWRGAARAVVPVLGVFAAVLLLMLAADGAEATHYRYGTLSWEETEGENEVVFRGAQAWRHSFFGDPPLGSTVHVGSIVTGDGGNVPLNVEVVAVNDLNDWFFGVFVDSSGDEGIPYTYSAANDAGDPWQAHWESCCRISPRSSGNFHVNNPDQSMRLEAQVDLDTADNSARTNLPPISNCNLNTTCEIPVPFVGVGVEDLSFRLATTAEAGDSNYVAPGPPHAPESVAIDPETGLVTWNTTGATHDSDWDNWRTLYSVQVVLETEATKTPLDFFIRIIPEDAVPPVWDNPSPICGTTQTVTTLNTVTFDLRARSDDIERTIRLDHLGLPSGASFPLPAPDNPVEGTFTWTPGRDQVGEHLVVFTAEDDLGLQAPSCPVTLIVEPGPYWDHPEIECGQTQELFAGRPFNATITARSDNTSRLITIDHNGIPSGASWVVTPPANPATGVFDWTPGLADVGLHTVVFTAVDDEGDAAPECELMLEVRLPEPRGQSMARSLWVGTAVPGSLEYSTQTVDQRGPGGQENLHTTVDLPELGFWAQGLQESGEVVYDLEAGRVTSTALTQAARVELSGGLVVLEGVEQEATLVFDLVEREHTLETRQEIARVEVAGEEVVVDDADGPVEVPLPGGGVLVLFERFEQEGKDRVLYHENLVHVYVSGGPDPAGYSRHEVIFGSLLLQNGGMPQSFAYQDQFRLILGDDDLATDSDAGDTPDTATPIAPGVHHGSTPPGDPLDYFEIDLAHGEKINLFLQPAPRATLTGGGLHLTGDPMAWHPILPGPHVSALSAYELRLYDPTGAERESSTLPVAGAPQRVELNADLDGSWVVQVKHLQFSQPESYNYTLGIGVSPVPLLPDEEIFNGPEACVPGDTSIPEIGTGVHPKTMQHEDFLDVYRFQADIGDLVTLTMKPGETLDGWSAALTLYDEDCQVLTRLDSDLLDLKGLPKVTAQLPSQYTGEYFVEVERQNGVGNYYLGLSVTDPFPQVPVVWDGDQPEDHQQADEAPPGFFQGDLPDDDPGDAYLLPFEQGKEAFVAVKMSTASTVDVRLYRPDGTTLVPPSQNALGGQLVLYRFEAPETGDYGLEIRPTNGGGTYGVGWGQVPVVIPEAP